MKILITGAAGYVGSYLAQNLIRGNDEVRLIDNYSTPSNITEIDGVVIENRDIRDAIDISDINVLVHCAAISGIKLCDENEEEAFNVNVKGTFNLLKTLKGKIVFPSSSAVYGESVSQVIDEGHEIEPRCVYGETKLGAEALIRLHTNYVILRFSNIYGHGLFCKRTVADMFIERALKKAPLEIHGDGKQRRDFVHINDAIRAYILAIKHIKNGVYNIGGDEALSINDIAVLVKKKYLEVFGYTTEIRHIPTDCGTKWNDFVYSSEQAKTCMRYEPLYSIGDEIRERLNANSRAMRN